MPISIFQQARESSPKCYSSCQLRLDCYQIDIGPGLVRGKFPGELLETKITDMERMPEEDSNLPTLHLNSVTKSDKLEISQVPP